MKGRDITLFFERFDCAAVPAFVLRMIDSKAASVCAIRLPALIDLMLLGAVFECCDSRYDQCGVDMV